MTLDRPYDPSGPLFESDDFKSIQFHVRLSNSATDLQSGKKESAEILEIGIQSLMIEARDKLCAPGHHMLVDIEGQNTDKIRFSATARVAEVESLPDSRARIELSLLQYDKSQWARIRDVMVSRQHEITDFLRKAKGY